MSINLVRKNADEPNIRNYDDARIFRYAVYGKSGIVKDYGEEIAFSQGATNILHIGTGEIIHQGWQVEISGTGIDISLDNRDSQEYYTIYLEINLAISTNQTATIKSLKGAASYPVVDPGDDLTSVTTGTSRVAIANVYLQPSTNTFLITPLIEIIPYYPTYSKTAEYASDDYSKGTIEERLTFLGFNSGVIDTSELPQEISVVDNSLIRQGKMCLCNLKLAADGVALGYGGLSFRIPMEFAPKKVMKGYGYLSIYYGGDRIIPVELTISPNGLIYYSWTGLNYNFYRLTISNLGWYTGDLLQAPTYTTQYDSEESGWDYYRVFIKNTNNTTCTLYYKLSGASSYTTVSLGPKEVHNIGVFRSDLGGTMYLEAGGIQSEIVSWSAS